MSGYQDNIQNDLCNREFMDKLNDVQSNYAMNVKAVMRDVPGGKCSSLSRTSTCSFYGPLNGKKVTQESFLQGRGQVLNDCPTCDVNYLPEALFSGGTAAASTPTCFRTDMEPVYDRIPRSCNGLTETDITRFAFMPSAYQVGYSGYNSVVDTHIQTRDAAYSACAAGVCNGGESYGCKSNYGSYGSGRSFKKYA